MSSSNTWVTVESRDGCSELYLQDNEYRIVASGVGRLHAKVTPGLYKLRQRVGDLEHSRIVEVLEDKALHLTLDGLAFASPIPLQGTISSQEFHQSALSATGATSASSGTGQLSLLLRDSRWNVTNPDPRRMAELDRELAALRIESFDGSYVAPLFASSHKRNDLGFARLSVNIPPGTYVLIQQVEEGNQRCVPLIVLQAWALHIFLHVGAPSPDGTSARLDLDHASIVYASPGVALEPTDPELLLLETVRKALARGRTSLAPDIVDRVLDQKFINPMLGLLGAHMLLSMPDAGVARAQHVVGNIAKLLGDDFPDVVALRMRLVALGLAKAPPTQVSIAAPPMLAASWTALTQVLAGSGPDLSLVLWFPITIEATSTWLVWNEVPGARAGAPPDDFEAFAAGPMFRSREARGRREPALEDVIEELLASDRLQPWVRELKQKERRTGAPAVGLGALERTLLATVTSAQATLIPHVIEPSSVASKIVANLRVPTRSAQRSARKLLSQLEKWQGRSSGAALQDES
jgi:hypothetical protein